MEHQARVAMLQSFDEDLMTEQQKLDQRYQMLIDAATKEGEDTTKITEWYEKEKTRIVEEEEEKQMQIRQAKLKAYEAIGNGIGDVLGSISDMMAEGTEEQKGLAIASTTIQMLTGIASALAMTYTTHTGWWDWAIGISQAASIAAAGIASITKISQVKSDGSGSSISVPSVNMGAVVASAPEFVQSVDGAMTQTAITDQKVYVTEHDITETQKKVQVAQNRATY